MEHGHYLSLDRLLMQEGTRIGKIRGLPGNYTNNQRQCHTGLLGLIFLGNYFTKIYTPLPKTAKSAKL